ncbi:MAG: hypothetical protein A2Y94_00175 [Caldithrix sp. RBG_13_44_9]|nr:MAG: hypothetical protein A2Y94_00175 [Caldithrix sp. RBG_13_44_9]
MKPVKWHFYVLLFIGVAALFSYTTPGMAQTEVTREEFSQFLQEYIEHLQQIMASGDTTLSEPTSQELRIRQWNDFVVKSLPKRFAVKVPIDNVTLKTQKYNRAEVEISFSFMASFPEQNFRFEDNLPGKNIELLSVIKDVNGQGWYEITPLIDILVIEANQARKYNIVKNKGYLLFGIKVALSREAGWTKFYQTVISFDWVKWMVDDGTIWEVEPLPIEEIFFKKED